MTEEQNKIEQITTKAGEDLNQDLMELALQGSEFTFEFKDVTYRVHKPTFADKQKIYKERVRKYTELLKDKTLVMESDLKAQYKERGIDIDEFQDKILALEQEKKSYQLKLGAILAGEGVESDAEIYKTEIQNIINKQTELSIKKTSLLEPCLEQQLIIYLYAYFTTLLVEKKVGETWVKVWNSYQEFEDSPDEEMVNKLIFYSALMMRDEIKV